MNRRRVLSALAGVLGAGVLLAGCGIPTTGVVEAGEPGEGVRRSVKLYFVEDALVRGKRDAGDPALVATSRRLEGPLGTEGVLRLLFAGLAPAERKLLALTTELPPVPYTVKDGGGRVAVDVTGVKMLSPTAVDQIVCTAISASLATPEGPPVTVTVTVYGVPQHGSADEDARCAQAAEPSPVKAPVDKPDAGAQPQG